MVNVYYHYLYFDVIHAYTVLDYIYLNLKMYSNNICLFYCLIILCFHLN